MTELDAFRGEVHGVQRDDAGIVRASVQAPELFEVIFDRHHARIWSYLARIAGRDVADDLAGDVFVAAFAHRDRYDRDRGSVQSWLYGIASNLARTRSRRLGRAARALGRTAFRQVQAEPPTDAVDDAIESRTEFDRVRDAMARLPVADREIIVLFAWERLTYKAIADALDIEVGTVRSRLSRARARLRELAGLSGELTVDG